MPTAFTSRLRLLAATLSLLGAAHAGKAQTIAGPTEALGSTASAQFIAGTIVSSDGPISGASIRLTGPGLVSVTNGSGDFYFPMPHGTGPQAAVVSYSGAADVTLTLTPGPQPGPLEVPAVQLSAPQRRALKKAMKYGHRQGRKDARSLR